MAEESTTTFLDELCEEMMTIDTQCKKCTLVASCRIMHANMPVVKDEVIVADSALLCHTKCDCGHELTETLPEGSLDFLGTRFELQLNDASNWRTRQVLKSGRSFCSLPEIGLNSAQTTGCAYTTVSELLQSIREDIATNAMANVSPEQAMGLMEFLQQMDEVIEGTVECTFVLEDPSGNSFVQRLGDEDEHLHAALNKPKQQAR